MTLFKIRVRIRLLSPLIFLLMIAFSGIQTVLPPLAALSVHELAHLCAAVCLKVQIHEIELMPFGAAMHLTDLWTISPGKILLIALAGPVCNLICCAVYSLILFFLPHLTPHLAPLLYANLLIACVNLLPALPLDGGRCLSALLSMKLKQIQAIKIGIILGRILGVFLIASSVYAFFRTHCLPLMPILSSIYLIASGEAEKRYAENASMQAVLKKSERFEPVRRAHVVMVQKNAPLLDAVRFVHPGEDSLFAITDDDGELLTLLPLKKLMFALHENASATVGNLVQKN